MFKSINKVIKILIISDSVLLFGWGLIAPILAVFVIQNIKGGDVGVVGIAIGIYWLIKSIIQIPIALFLDRTDGEKDDYFALILGNILASFTPIGFIFATLPWHMYALQAFYAVAMAMVIPSWGGIFVRHIEKRKEALCWGLESSAIGIGIGLAGVLGGITAKIFGFVPLFIGVAILNIITVLLLLLIRKELLAKKGIYLLPKQ